MQIDVVDITGEEARAHQRLLHGHARAQSFGMRSGHVVSIAAFADTEQRDRIRRPAVCFFLQQYHACAFADGNAIAISVEGAASDRGEQAERAKAIQRGET